ncbi:MAG: DUF3795 domain-containing protein [Candidatus Lokiarchaeota archaeon]|nr:DUF3795 domain-containing protein [Candidatus Lokiarchaeota archaeon]
MIFIKKIAYCGDDCSECPRYLATINGSLDMLRESAILMEKVGWHHDLDNLDKMKCYGCEDINECEYGVKDCCIVRGVANCGACNEYPCVLINKAFDITATYVEKFKTILSSAEYDTFQKAFFSKKKNLDEINKLSKLK